MKDLSIVFVNWNSLGYVRKSISTIYENTQGIDFEIIVVDNASVEGGAEELENEHPDVKVIRSAENLGFARANNLGFRHSSGRCVLFLNPDTELLGPAINIMLGELERNPGMGIVGCRLLNSDLSVQTQSIQKFPTILNQLFSVERVRLMWPRCRLWEIGPLFVNYKGPVQVEVIPGACMLLRREVFEAAGLFSEEYFMYAEDIDLNYKVARLGLGSYYVGDATIVHHGGKSSERQKANQWAIVMKFRAMLLFYRKTRGRLYSATYRIAMGCVAVLRLAALVITFPLAAAAGEGRNVALASAKWLTILRCAAYRSSSPG